MAIEVPETAEDKLAEHEAAAHQKRNWVRLTYECNDRCIFCLDSDTHDGEMRSPEEVKRQILDGRRKGAERLILSGGEPTIHPRYVDFIKLGRRAGYDRIQTVTNGRMFRYRPFIKKCIDAGLGEITFSIHGHNAKIHDALVGVKGAFVQEVEGLKAALDDGRVIINIDVCVNRANVKTLSKLIETFVEMGVKEYDLLQVIPFGRAFDEGQETLFYDLDAHYEYLQEAFAWSKRPDMHIWLNRFPPQHCEGFEHLIQDPYKLNDEVRGRKEEYERLLTWGTQLDCREPVRCGYCYMQRVCDTLEDVRETVSEARFDVVRVDTEWEAEQPPVYGGDPASARKFRQGPTESDSVGATHEDPAKMRLPLFGQPQGGEPIEYLEPPALAERAGAQTLQVVAPSLAEARPELDRFPSVANVALELDDYDGLAEALDDEGCIGRHRLVSVFARTSAQAEALLAIEGDFEVIAALTTQNVPWLVSLERAPERLALRQLTWEKLTESRDNDVDLREFFAEFRHDVPVEGVPACVLGRSPRPKPETLDTAMMTPDGKLEIFRYIKRFILDRYFSKSLRCRDCIHTDACRGMHINYIRAHGYGVMQPVHGADVAAAE